MKYYKRLNIWKASNISFNPETEEAYSYRHWCFVKRIGNKMVFNDYTYSNTTSRHQSKIQYLLQQLGYNKLEHIESPRGLNNLSSAITYYEAHIFKRKELIAKPGTHKSTNQRRQEEIVKYEGKLALINKLRYYDEFDWEVEAELVD